MERKNKKILLVVIATIIMLSVSMAAISVNAENQGNFLNMLKGTPPVETTENIPQQVAPLAVEQATYTDVWVKSNTTVAKTSSTGVIDIPSMSLTITTKYPSDLIITFSSEAMTSSANQMGIRTLVDGNPAGPGGVIFTTGTPYYQAHSYNFYKINVPAGKHTIKMQWQSAKPSPEYIQVWYRTLTVIANGAGHPP